MLGIEADPPELDERTAFWMRTFRLMSKGRPVTMGGLAPIPPLDIMETIDRLHLPCDYEEAIEVIGAMDDEWREMNRASGE